jgi:hypothetical protein
MLCRGTHLIAFNRYLRTGRSGCSKSVIFMTRQVCSPGNGAPSGLAARLFCSSHLVDSFGAAGTCWLIGNGVGLQTMPNILGIQGASPRLPILRIAFVLTTAVGWTFDSRHISTAGRCDGNQMFTLLSILGAFSG